MSTPWWKRSVVYQIYPRSFHDSNGDGVGDLNGITEKVDYLEWLGIDTVWLGPVYDSPMDDNGYDIRDYRAIAAEFGTMADWERMLAALHARGIRLIMDLVVNHTSDEHAWFRDSRAATDAPKRDWYVWRPPAPGGGPPNNWASFFGGSAWAFDEATGEYYLHLFSRKQPDLNWENPEVRAAIHDMVRWWLGKGIDGFRLDAINLISKPPGLPDEPERAEPRFQVPFSAFNGPRLLEYLRELQREAFAEREVMTVGETAMVEAPYGLELTHRETGGLGMVHQFEFTELDKDFDSHAPRWIGAELDLVAFKRVFARWQETLEPDGWNANFLSNHDLPRPVSRYGDDERDRRASATALATLIFGLKGTPFIYQGDEIGMTNVAFDSVDAYRDVEVQQMYREFTGERAIDSAEVMAMIHAKSRDNARTPVQWTAGHNAGFTDGDPWIGVNPNHTEINVAAQLEDPHSVLAYHRRLIALRREVPALLHGRFDLLLPDHPALFAFTREGADARLLVAINLSGEVERLELPPDVSACHGALLIGNDEDLGDGSLANLELRPWEARIYRVVPPT